MTTSWLGYQRYALNDSKSVDAMWNSDGTLLVFAEDGPPQFTEQGQRLYSFSGWDKRVSVRLMPDELKALLSIPPKEVFHKFRVIPGLVAMEAHILALAYDDGTMEIGGQPHTFGLDVKPELHSGYSGERDSIRLPLSEWQKIYDACMNAGRQFMDRLGIYPIFATHCREQTKLEETL